MLHLRAIVNQVMLFRACSSQRRLSLAFDGVLAGPAAAELSQLEGIFTFALIWSVGATGDTDGRAAFDVFFKTLLAGGLLEKDLQELIPMVRHLGMNACTSVGPLLHEEQS